MAETALCAAIGIADTKHPPEWLHLLPAGEVRTNDGRGPYRVLDSAAVIARSMAGGAKLVLDENHATDLAAPNGHPAPARGWIVELQHRFDGIWGRVEWTPAALQSTIWRDYRGISPAIVHGKDGVVTAIARASLTNLPNLTGLTSLHRKESGVELRSTIIQLLGLQETDDDQTIVNKLKLALGHKDVVAMHSATPVQAQQLALQATAYRAKLARDGINITLPAAVRAVQDGRANL